MRRTRGHAASEARDDLAHWPVSADVEQQSAERSRAACNPRLVAVVRKTEDGSRGRVEGPWCPGAADRGRNCTERGDVSGCGKENGGGSEAGHARRMRRGVPMTAIAPKI